MGEHGTWFDYLYTSSWYQHFAGEHGTLDHALGRKWQWMMFQGHHWSLTHVWVALLVVGFVIFGAAKFRAATAAGDSDSLVPPRKLTVRNTFELLCDAILSMMTGVMGEKNAKRFFPLIGSLALFILFSNVAALIPGMSPATDTLKTNLALSVLVFLLYNYYGLKEHGVGYLKHFMGPVVWLAPLMVIIEVISHLVRPASLALRLMGNMAADHKVLFVFFSLVPLIIPVPFYILGLLVCIVQTLVFCLLAMVYIQMAIAHDH